MRKLIEWTNHRTGLDFAMREALYETIPGGPRLRYVTGSMLVFAFMTQMITGLFLWMGYSPSSQTAWESVYYIQHEMTGGWLLRGIHHFMAQAMIVVLAMHMLQVIIDGAYRAPREMNYWIGLVLMQLVLALGLTGYLLPWDQKGFWATNVATNLMTLVPVFGQDLQRLVLGGDDYGHHTLTRFFALHAGILPALLVAFLVLHLLLFRRHGIHARLRAGRADAHFWPKQVLLDALASLAMLVVVLLLCIHFDVGGLVAGDLPEEHLGAELGSPADPSEQYSAARPEWYFYFLFQLLKYFDGKYGFANSELMGALIVPGVIMLVLSAAPLIGRWKIGHRFNQGFVVAILLGAGVLTIVAWVEDANDEDFQTAKIEAEHEARRVRELIERRETIDFESGELSPPQKIQGGGAIALVRNDPLLQGPKLFSRHCASCHPYGHKDAEQRMSLWQEPETKTNDDGQEQVVRDESGQVNYKPIAPGAPDLYGFATREWIAGLLDPTGIDRLETEEPAAVEGKSLQKDDRPSAHRRRIVAPYFGNTFHRHGRMADFVQGDMHKQLLASAAESKERDDAETALDEAESKLDEIKSMVGEEPDAAGKQQLDAAEAAVRQAEQEVAGAEQKIVEDMVGDIAAALSAQARLPAQRQQENRPAEQERIRRGLALIEKTCANHCHKIGGHGQWGLAPDLTGYGSFEWMMGMVSDPEHARFYRGENDRMPRFAADLDAPAADQVSRRELGIIVDWLRGEYYRQDDEYPTLPHSEEEARAAVRLARLTPGGIEPRVVGAAVGAEGESPQQRAERLFTNNCAACHTWLDQSGEGIRAGRPSAPNLHNFGSRTWLKGFFDPERIVGPQYFGNTAHDDGMMVELVTGGELADPESEESAAIAQIIAALSAEAKLPYQQASDQAAEDAGEIEAGREAFAEIEFSGIGSSCAGCHTMGEAGDGVDGPNLTGWGSRDWIKQMVAEPAHYYESNDRMPAFGRWQGEAERPNAKPPLLSEEEIDLLARWLRREPL